MQRRCSYELDTPNQDVSVIAAVSAPTPRVSLAKRRINAAFEECREETAREGPSLSAMGFEGRIRPARSFISKPMLSSERSRAGFQYRIMAEELNNALLTGPCTCVVSRSSGELSETKPSR
jgi:hypothetical protein